MKYKKKLVVFVLTCLLLFSSNTAKAFGISTVVDKTISYTAKGTYHITKFALKTSWFIVKQTSKGVYVVSKGVFNATKDSLRSDPKPASTVPENDNLYETLPPPPEVPDNSNFSRS